MGNNEKPTQTPTPVDPQVTVVFDLQAKRINVIPNIEDSNMIIGLLIDALSIMYKAKLSQEKNKIVLASPSIIKPS